MHRASAATARTASHAARGGAPSAGALRRFARMWRTTSPADVQSEPTHTGTGPPPHMRARLTAFLEDAAVPRHAGSRFHPASSNPARRYTSLLVEAAAV